MNKKIKDLLVFSGVIVLSIGIIKILPMTGEDIKAKYSIPTSKQVYENKKYKKLEFLSKLIDDGWNGLINLNFPDITVRDDKNVINIDPENNIFYIIEDGEYKGFKSKEEILYYLYQVGLL